MCLGFRPVLLATGAAGVAWVLGRLTAPLRHPVAGSYEDLLVALAAWVLLGAATWAAAIAVAALVETISAGRVRALSWVGTPPAVRRALMLTLGLALAGGLPGPVSAEVRRHTAPAPHRPAALTLPVPDRLPPAPARRSATVRVASGDTLWALAAARLPGVAEDARVWQAVHRWYARNRVTIGADPDLILPGQRLVVPGEDQR